jgi:hypothetical protein
VQHADSLVQHADSTCATSLGTSHIRMWCGSETVAAHDILLLYDSPLLYSNVTEWVSASNNFLVDAAQARRSKGKGVGLGVNRISAEHMPPSVTPRAVHFFGPAAATWHIGNVHNPECFQMLPGRWGNSSASCQGAAEYAGGALAHHGPYDPKSRPNTSESAACEITAAFCSRFVSGGAVAIRKSTPSLSARTTALYGHGLSSVMARPGVVSYKFHELNPWQTRVARALNPATRPAMCGSDLYSAPSDGIFCGGVRLLFCLSFSSLAVGC